MVLVVLTIKARQECGRSLSTSSWIEDGILDQYLVVCECHWEIVRQEGSAGGVNVRGGEQSVRASAHTVHALLWIGARNVQVVEDVVGEGVVKLVGSEVGVPLLGLGDILGGLRSGLGQADASLLAYLHSLREADHVTHTLELGQGKEALVENRLTAEIDTTIIVVAVLSFNLTLMMDTVIPNAMRVTDHGLLCCVSRRQLEIWYLRIRHGGGIGFTCTRNTACEGAVASLSTAGKASLKALLGHDLVDEGGHVRSIRTGLAYEGIRILSLRVETGIAHAIFELGIEFVAHVSLVDGIQSGPVEIVQGLVIDCGEVDFRDIGISSSGGLSSHIGSGLLKVSNGY